MRPERKRFCLQRSWSKSPKWIGLRFSVEYNRANRKFGKSDTFCVGSKYLERTGLQRAHDPCDHLTAYLSDDEGATWQWKRSLETNAVQASYPSVIQLEDGTIYCTYTYYLPRDAEGRKIRSIKWAHFSETWVQAGEVQQE